MRISIHLFISIFSIDEVYDGFEEAQTAAVVKTSKRVPIAATDNPFVSEVEAVRDDMTLIGLNEATTSTPDPNMEIDVFGDTVTRPEESKPLIEIKKGKRRNF